MGAVKTKSAVTLVAMCLLSVLAGAARAEPCYAWSDGVETFPFKFNARDWSMFSATNNNSGEQGLLIELRNSSVYQLDSVTLKIIDSGRAYRQKVTIRPGAVGEVFYAVHSNDSRETPEGVQVWSEGHECDPEDS